MKKQIVFPLDDATWRIVDGSGSAGAYLYLLAGRDRAMLIDTGIGLIDAAQIVRGLTDRPVFVVNTHGHLDHISANHRFDTAYLHPKDEAVFAEHAGYAGRYGFVKGLLAEMKLPAWALKLPLVKGKINKICDLPQVNNRKPLAEGQTFDLGGRKITVIETPGHTQGSVCLLEADRRWLFTGDTVCDEGVLLHFPHSAPVAVFQASIRKLQALGDQFDVMWPGHHRAPLEKDLLDQYVTCAQRVLDGEKGAAISSAAGSAQILRQGTIALSFPPEKG